MLNTENKLWLESSANLLGVRPESLLNALLRQIRNQLGILEEGKALEDWLLKSEKIEGELKIALQESKKTMRVLTETLKATQLYLNQIQGTQVKPDPPQS